MKHEKGFSLIEVLIASSIVVVITGATLVTLTTALNATQMVTQIADTQENLRAGMNAMVRDIIQTGEGIPQGGITIPNSGGSSPTSSVNRPGSGTGWSMGTFKAAWTALPAIIAGYQQGPATSVSGGVGTDMITVLYADTTLVDSNGHWLNEFPIKIASTGTPGCAATNSNPQPQGSIVTSGTTTTITFDTSCINIGSSINPGDLIMLENNNSTVGSTSTSSSDSDVANSPTSNVALLTVSNVPSGANQLVFNANDAFNLNGTSQAAGTIAQLGTFPLTTATRIWMITYYVNNTNAQNPQLMRQVNMNQPQAIAEGIENLQLYYDILNAVAAGNPVSVTAGQEAPSDAQLPYIRDAYILLYAHSRDQMAGSTQLFRNNLETVVSIRGLDFYNEFQ